VKIKIKTIPISQLTPTMNTIDKGITEAMKRPKYKLLSSSLAKAGTVFIGPRCLKDISKTAPPSIRQTLTMFEPKTFPTETGACSVKGAMMPTPSSGSEVEKASRRKPTVAFPSPVISETLTEPVIAQRLPISNITRKKSRTSTTATISKVDAHLKSQ